VTTQAYSARLALPGLHCLIDAELIADFHCREGWSRLGERWRGVRLRTLLALARLDRQADQP
jgi:DMSO/TMAO reductase YedYZ molybdopterin-dependent catalytic subunit